MEILLSCQSEIRVYKFSERFMVNTKISRAFSPEIESA